ncbi:MAG: hypothetical protein J6568_06855 [Snodgrassella sp.]|nr:hypothetical protein [Snodgrassella sp.]
MILKNFDIAYQYINCENNNLIISNNLMKINGWCKNINNNLSALVVYDNKLFYLFDKKYGITNEYHIKLKDGNNKRERIFELMKKDKFILSFIYEIDRIIEGNSPFEYIDDEDSDWGIFVENRINNLTKKTILSKY